MDPIHPEKHDSLASWFLSQKGLSMSVEALAGGQVPIRQSAFVMLARQHVLKMKREQADYLPEATDRLVSAGLRLALGPNISKQPEEFEKMKATITEKIMKNPEYRKKLEKFISILEKFDQA